MNPRTPRRSPAGFLRLLPLALAAAVYAYAFLFGRQADEALQPFDPRVDVARNVYNIGLTRALSAPDGTVALESVESEKVVRHSDHSVQERPEGIQELRRILVEHLGSGG